MATDTDKSARSVSIDILNKFDDTQDLDYGPSNALEPSERAKVREYVQNILRRRSYLDFLIDHFASVKIGEMKSNLKNLLRLAIYELVFMDGSPDYATINEAVNIAKLTISHKTGDLVNAILRNMQRELDDLPKPNYEDRTKLVATTFSHPEWMVRRWVKRFGEREAFKLMQSNNKRPHYFVRVNTLRTKRKYFRLRLEKKEVPFEESDWLPGFFKVDSVRPFIEMNLLKRGFCQVQDIAAGFAPTILDPQSGETIYDLCSAPGTKAIMISDLMEGEGTILAVDRSSNRLDKLAESALDYHAENIKIRRADVRELELDPADRVMLDAPCTGTGVLSKRADLRWKRTEEDLQDLVELQKELLDSAAKMVKPGGKLVYSTCSLEEEENMQQVKQFLERHEEFSLDSLKGYIPEELLVEENTAYQTYPHRHHCDGHFGVRLTRKQ